MHIALIIIFIIGFIFSGILLLKKSAKELNLTEEQMKTIKEREVAQKKQDDDD